MRDKSLRNKLKSVDRHITGDKPKKKQTVSSSGASLLAERFKGKALSNFAGSYCLIKTVYNSDYVHGESTLSQAITTKKTPFSAVRVENSRETINDNKLLFLDTETTGLGGTGAVAFLVGCGVVSGNKFIIRQYLLPDYSDETAMLEALTEEFSGDTAIVTYNGAAFDIPLLTDRLIINRVAREIPLFAGLDLLPAVRRLFKRRLGDCSLTNIESELLNFSRRDDIPGYLIPSVYFEWLSERNLDMMENVLEHNRLDIISMFFLIKYLTDIFDTDGRTLDQVDDLHSLSRLHGRRRQPDQVASLYDRINDLSRQTLKPDILLYHSLNFKRQGDWEAAVEMWERLAGLDSKEGYYANLELAKYYEHRAKNLKLAVTYAKQAIKCNRLASQDAPLQHRLDRLIHKLSIR